VYVPPPPPPAPPAVGVTVRSPNSGTSQREKAYMMELSMKESRPGERDRTLHSVQLAFVEGKPAKVHVGSRFALNEGSIQDLLTPAAVGPEDQVSLGNQVQVKVVGLKAGQVRVDLEVQRNDIETASKDGILIMGSNARMVRKVQLGKPVKLVLDRDDEGKARTRIEFKVTEMKR
jgi:hypothetical protein